MLVIGIILIILSILTAIGIAMDHVGNKGSFFRCVFGSMLSVVATITGIIMIIDSCMSPTALDVYRGNTKLQIEQKVVNNEVISSDSTVVWKK